MRSAPVFNQGESMPRKPLIRTNEHPYHVVSRVHNKRPFPLPLDFMWNIFQHKLHEIQKEYGLEIYAFVLMKNHFHLFCKTPNANLDIIMFHLLSYISRRVNSESGDINHLFGTRYRWNLIQGQGHFFNVYRYIYQNPIRAGVVKNVELYPYSTLHDGRVHIQKDMTELLMQKEFLDWLNRDLPDSAVHKMRMQFRKRVLSEASHDASRKCQLPYFNSAGLTNQEVSAATASTAKITKSEIHDSI